MHIRSQKGYMDNQSMPVLIGALIMFILVGQINESSSLLQERVIAFYICLGLALLAMSFGLLMHIDAVSEAESPFNKHGSGFFIYLLCFGSLGHAAYRFYPLESLIPFSIVTGLLIIYLLALLVSIIKRGKE